MREKTKFNEWELSFFNKIGVSFTAEVVRLKPVDWLLVCQPVFNYCPDVDVHNALKATWLTFVLVGPSMCVYWNVSACVTNLI